MFLWLNAAIIKRKQTSDHRVFSFDLALRTDCVTVYICKRHITAPVFPRCIMYVLFKMSLYIQ